MPPAAPAAVSRELRQLARDLRALYQDRLGCLEGEGGGEGGGGGAAAARQLKEQLLQSYVTDLSNQNDILVQTVEELENLVFDLREAAVADPEPQPLRPSLARRSMPAECLSEATATETVFDLEQEESRILMAPKKDRPLWLAQAQEQAQDGWEEATSSPEKPVSSRVHKRLRKELEQQAAKILRLHSQLLLGQDERHRLAEELAAQEQRVHQMQTTQRETQAALEQRCSRILRLERDLEASCLQQQECQQKLIESQGWLAQAEGENMALRAHSLQQVLEMEQLMSSQTDCRSSCLAVAAQMEEELAELRVKLAGAQAELQQKEAQRQAVWMELQDTQLLADGATTRLAVAETEVVALRSKYTLAFSESRQAPPFLNGDPLLTHQLQPLQAVVQSDALRRLQETHDALQERVVAQEDLICQLQVQAHNLQSAQEQGAERSQAVQEALEVEQPPLEECCQSLQEATERRQVGARDQAIVKLQGCLKTAEEEQAQVENELTGKEAEINCLRGKLHHVQAELTRWQDACREQETAMVEQSRVIRQLQRETEASLSQSQTKATLLEQLQGELQCSQQAHQAGMEQLQEKLQRLQQELDACKGRNQENLSKLQARECTLEKQSLDLDLLLQQCQILKDQLFYYEEVTHKQELELTQQHAKVAQAESSADLYKKSSQASLARAGELEQQLRHLEEELAAQDKAQEGAIFKLQAEQLLLQEALKSQRQQAAEAEDAVRQLTQELRGAHEALAQGRHLAYQSEETVQELQKQLAAGHAKLLDQEEALAALQRDFASYRTTHSCSNSSYESQIVNTETLRQKLLQVEDESSEHQRRAVEFDSLVQDLKLELLRVAEQNTTTLKDMARLELDAQSLRQEAAVERERQQLAAAGAQQQIQQLEAELQHSHKLCAQKEQAIQRRDELLQKSQADMDQARSALQEKSQEVEQLRARTQTLEANLQKVQQELGQSRDEEAAVHLEVQVLRQSVQESQERQQQAAQELVQQEEQLLLSQSNLRSTQEQLTERITEVLHLTQAGHQLEVERQGLTERLSSSEAERERTRELLAQLAEELAQSKQQHQAASQEAQEHLRAASHLELKLESLQQKVQAQESVLAKLHAEAEQQRRREDDLQRQLQRARERESVLAQERQAFHHQVHSSELKLQEEECKSRSLQASLAEQEVENRALQEQLRQKADQLEVARGGLEHAQLKLQQQAAEALRQEAALAQLCTQLHTAQEKERHTAQTLAAAKSITQELKRQATSWQASQREALEQLEQRAREVSCLQAERQLARHQAAHLEDNLALSQEQVQQLRAQLQALQQQREQEACTSEERLDELSGQLQGLQKDLQEAEHALAEKEEELVVVKVELASREGKCHDATAEREELQNEVNLLRQKCVISSQELESLHTSLETARADSRRLHCESELVVANVSQWVKEQKQVNEKLGHKIRDQIKQIAQLTGERDHLHGLTERLQQENKWLKNEVDDRRIECERLKALHSNDWDPRSLAPKPCPALPGGDDDDTHGSARRRSKVLAAKWHFS